MPPRVSIALVAAVLTACGAGAQAGAPAEPTPSITGYADALARGDAEATLAMEADSAHRGRDGAAQAARMEDARAELAALGSAMAEAPPAALREHARVPLASGELVVMARDPDGGWRIEGGVLGVPALVAPRDAIAALRSALARRDLRGVEEVLARRTRAAWEDEVARVVEQTADPDALQIRLDGDRAIVTTPGGVRIELVREADEWRVLDVQPDSRIEEADADGGDRSGRAE